MGQEEWPREAFRATLLRYGRMPRFGWKRLVNVFCDKFSVSLSVKEIKLKPSHCWILKMAEGVRLEILLMIPENATNWPRVYLIRVHIMTLACSFAFRTFSLGNLRKFPICDLRMSYSLIKFLVIS